MELKPEDIKVETLEPKNKLLHPGPAKGVRLTHIPSGAYVEEVEHPSKHGNLKFAMKRLKLLVQSMSDSELSNKVKVTEDNVQSITVQTLLKLNDYKSATLMDRRSRESLIDDAIDNLSAIAKFHS